MPLFVFCFVYFIVFLFLFNQSKAIVLDYEMYPLLFTVAVVEGVSNSIYRKERPAEYCQDESGTLFLLLCPNYCQKV